MVASAVLGAAAGTGVALLAAMTIVLYRYYSHKKKTKEWGSLDKMPYPPNKILLNKPIYAVAQTVSSSIFHYLKLEAFNIRETGDEILSC